MRDDWTLDTAIKIIEGAPALIWLPRNRTPRALVHWGRLGKLVRRAVCPGGFVPRGLSPRICPICAYIEANGQAQGNEDGWKAKRQFYTPALEGMWMEVDGKQMAVFNDILVRLLGSGDGFGMRLHQALKASIESRAGGVRPEPEAPFGYAFEIVRAGAAGDTSFSAQKVAAADCVLPPLESLEDPERLLEKGLFRYVEPTSVDECKRLMKFEQSVRVSVAGVGGEAPATPPTGKKATIVTKEPPVDDKIITKGPSTGEVSDGSEIDVDSLFNT
jgi:hypothetical protein